MSIRRACRFPAGTCPAFILSVTMLAAILTGTPGAGAAPARPGQMATRAHLPHLVSAGYSPTLPVGLLHDAPSSGTHGMFSWGESTVELQNLTGARVDVTLELPTIVGYPGARADRRLEAYASGDVRLAHTAAITPSDYAGVVSSSGAVGVLARTTWDGSAAAVYEAPEAARSLLLPLFAANAFTHTSVLWFTNTDADQGCEIELEVTDLTGSMTSWTFPFQPKETRSLDPNYLGQITELAPNAGAGFMGAAHITSDRPIAVIAYGDEAEGRGVSAIAARPVAAASEHQYLPLVRANVGGDSIIAIASPTGQPVDVVITYRGSPASPSGANQTFEQRFSIGTRLFALVDLDPIRRRGSVAAPPLPRGVGASRGFYGTASIQASGPVLASVLEQDVRYDSLTNRQTIRTSAAYNAYGPGDLGTTFFVPRARINQGGYTSNIVVMNPGTTAVTAQVDWNDGATSQSSGPQVVPAGQLGVVVLSGAVAGGLGRAVIQASGPIAPLVYDVASDLDRTAYWPVKAAVVGPLPTPPTWTPTSPATPTRTPTATSTRAPTTQTHAPPTASRTARPPTSVPTPGGTPPTDFIYLPVAFRERDR